MIAKVEIFPAANKMLMTIPVDALLTADGTIGYVYVAQNEQVVRKRIEISHFNSEYIYVQKGLNVNDKVITTGKEKLDEGEAIELTDN
jgi:multidrug efflux pump subunit AcrA (membrane-fusion protein)